MAVLPRQPPQASLADVAGHDHQPVGVLGVQRALRIVIPQIREGTDAELPEPLAQPVLQVLALVGALVEQQRRGLAEKQARLPRPFFMFAQAPSAGLRSGA